VLFCDLVDSTKLADRLDPEDLGEAIRGYHERCAVEVTRFGSRVANYMGFNAYGGEMPQTWGVPVEEIVEGIRFGVRKINIDTDCRLAMAGQIRKVAAEKKAEFDLRAFLRLAMAALKKRCAERFEDFGTAGQAPKLKPVPLPEMATRYLKGELNALAKQPIRTAA